MKNWQTILGVSANPTEKQIKTAYRKLASKYHPDRNKDKDAENMFKQVREAYEYAIKWISIKTEQYTDTVYIPLKYQSKGGKFKTANHKFIIEIPPHFPHNSQKIIIVNNSILLVTVIFIHDTFSIAQNGIDVYATISVESLDIIMGTEIIVEHPYGNKIKVGIPTSFVSGSKILVKNKGIKNTYTVNNILETITGHLYITVNMFTKVRLTKSSDTSILLTYKAKPYTIS